ncbi:hypothetical protein CDO52_07005 [Nocardiopsis gilva YIM 90087]|uniref:Uncharacterized protein n=1 Tax=Nocardiopsis gilva YIM 90087 TaxID=1235441 RepID=A0A223S364_9ACTN|nr:hypothetical protein [Nocardiopsis gilva]ASU82564.1 hypothetical protein CDO52_07005 [Nocardiopsis gilva YIM 90087]
MSEPDRTTDVAEPTPGAFEEKHPSDLSLSDSGPELLGKTFRAYIRHLWPLVVAVGVPLALLVLLVQPGMVWMTRDAVYVNGSLELLSAPDTSMLWTAVGFTVFGLLCVPIPVGALVLLGGGALLGRTVSVRDAWCGALRRYFTTLTWIVVMILLVATALAAILGLGLGMLTEPPEWLEPLTELPVWLATGMILLPLLLLVVPATVMLPVALLEGHGPLRGLAVAWRMGRYRRRVHVLFAIAFFGVSSLASRGLAWALQSQLGWGDGHPISLGVSFLVCLLATPLSVLLMCAPVVFQKHYPKVSTAPQVPRNLNLAWVEKELPKVHLGGRSWAVMPLPALVSVLLLPPLVGSAAVWANTFDTPHMTSSPIESVRGDELMVDLSP